LYVPLAASCFSPATSAAASPDPFGVPIAKVAPHPGMLDPPLRARLSNVPLACCAAYSLAAASVRTPRICPLVAATLAEETSGNVRMVAADLPPALPSWFSPGLTPTSPPPAWMPMVCPHSCMTFVGRNLADAGTSSEEDP